MYSFCVCVQTIDRLIETGDSEQIFHKAIQEQGRGQVCGIFWCALKLFCPVSLLKTYFLGQILDTLDEIQQRHDAVKDIERKLLNLHQVFPTTCE